MPQLLDYIGMSALTTVHVYGHMCGTSAGCTWTQSEPKRLQAPLPGTVDSVPAGTDRRRPPWPVQVRPIYVSDFVRRTKMPDRGLDRADRYRYDGFRSVSDCTGSTVKRASYCI